MNEAIGRRSPELLNRLDETNERDLTIFVPCRNESGNISRTLNEIVSTLRAYEYSYELIVVDDASTDQSVAEIEDFMRSHPDVSIKLKRNLRTMGVSYNICDAAILGRGRHFQFISGAFQNRNDALRAVFDELGNADLILTYLDPDMRVLGRRTLSRLYTRLVNLISGYNIRHYHGTPLFLRVDVVRWHSYRTVGFYPDMITRLLDEGITYIQVPTPCHEREIGKSRALRLRNIISLFIGFADLLLRRCSKERIGSVEVPNRGAHKL